MAEPNEQIIDEILVLDCQSGHAEALDLLVERWQRRLWRYACRLTGDAEAAWEVTQESWLGIVRGIRRLHDPARFRSWAYRIVTNKANDWIRRKVGRARVEPSEAIDPPACDDRSAREAEADLEVILHRLPERSRMVLTLYYLEELGLAEISRILRVPIGTVKSRLHHARAEFKRLWQAANTASEPPAVQKGAEP